MAPANRPGSEKQLVEELKKILPGLTQQIRVEFDKEEERRKKKASSMGAIGRLIGDPSSAPYSIGLIIVVLSFSFLAAAMIFPPRLADQDKLVQGMLAVLTTTLGYLFGYKTSGRR